MEEREVIISNNKKVVVKEIKFKDSFSKETKDKIEKEGYQKTMLQLSTGLSDEEYNNLSQKDGLKLWKTYFVINEEDFQNPQTEVELLEQQ